MPPVSYGGTTVVVSATALDDFVTLEERLDAYFAELEARFAAFEARAQNGFGRFDESGGNAASIGQGTNALASISRRPRVLMHPGHNSNGSNEAVLTQNARAEEMTGADSSDRPTARKDTKPKLEKARKTKKRDRHHGKQRNRR